MSITKWMLILWTTVLHFTQTATASEPRVVCYYTNWSVYRPGTAKFNPQNINPYLCTHLIYAFGGFTKDNTLKPFDKYQDIEKGGYAKFTGLKTYNKELKTMLAIGGWNEGSSRFSPMVASKQRRKEFVKNAIKFLRQNRFDGLDLDWEYPAFRDGGKPKDRDNYARLVRELRAEFEREADKTGRARLLLTMAVPAGIEYIQKGYDVPKLNQYLDWFNILTYDYHSAYEPAVNHHSPLYPLEEPSEYSVDAELNIDYTIKFYLENGADADKLVLGIPTYGRSYTLFNADARELGAPADGPGEQGDATKEKGYLAYYEICEYVKSPQKSVKKTKRANDDEDDEDYEDDESSPEEDPEDEPWTVVQPAPDAMGPYAVRGNQWVGYDDIDIVRKKAEYVADKGLGGIMFWSIDNDDFRGSCHNKPYPLIEAAKEALIAKLGISDNAISSDKQTSTSALSRNKSRSRGSSAVKISSSTEGSIPESRQNKKGVPATTPTWSIRTPEPPTTPDPGSDFKCTEEGFFDHPRDCKKYFWCLDSGPSNLGIVAHQFTCPSGLFFNKAADSCDFARNVFCKKDKITTSTTTTSAPTTARTPTVVVARTTTTRAVSTRSTTIRSALARAAEGGRPSLFRSTSSTPTHASVKGEEEDADGDGYDLTNTGLLDTEEDPKVIKELISLIRKAGGVDQLEKQLKLGESSSPGRGGTTAAPTGVSSSARAAAIPKKLYERVLSNTRSPTFNTKIDDNAAGYNSRFRPQNADLEKIPELNSIRKDRPKYTSINRTRSSTSTTETPDSGEDDDGEDENEEEKEISGVVSKFAESYTQKSFMPQYVNIRRTKATTMETPKELGINSDTRNALFERNESVLRTTTSGAIQSNVESGSKTDSLNPEYVSIRRGKPVSATEETSNGATSIYQTIVKTRGTTTDSSLADEENAYPITLKPEQTNEVGYVTIQRTRSTSTPSTENNILASSRATESSLTIPEKLVTVSLGTPTTTVLNAQITTLLNTAATSVVKETVPPTTSITEVPFPSTVIHIAEAVFPTITTTTTEGTPPSIASTKTILKKRTRPTTTLRSTEATTTTTVKVSGEKKYAFIRRTRPAKLTTEPTIKKSNFDEKNNVKNDFLSNVDEKSLSKETVGATSYRSSIRKIRSTTPNSRELEAEEDTSSYGSKIGESARRRPVYRQSNDTRSKIESNGENGYVTRHNTVVTASFDEAITKAPTSRAANRFRGTQRNKIEESINDNGVSGSSVINNNVNTRHNRFRSTQARDDLPSLTYVEKISEPKFVPRSRSAQANTRTYKSKDTTEKLVDSVNSDSSVTSIVRPRPELIPRGRSRFTTQRTTPLVGNGAKLIKKERKFNITRFSPRPFSRFSYSTISDLPDSDDEEDGITKDVENVLDEKLVAYDDNDNIDTEITTALPSLGVTRVIGVNTSLGQSNNRSRLLFLQRSQTPSTTESQFEDESEIKNDDIDLSASEHLEESKEHHEEEKDHSIASSERPRKIIIVKKLRPISNISETPADMAVESSNSENELDTINSGINKEDKPMHRRVKIIRRRPAKTLAVRSEPSENPTLHINAFENVTENTNTQNSSRIRKIIRKKVLPTPADFKNKNKTYTDDVAASTPNVVDINQTNEEPVIATIEHFTIVTSSEAPSSTIAEEAFVSISTLSPTTLRSRFERPLYRPNKKTPNFSPTTETPTSSTRTFSRKYNLGAYTSPPTPNRDSPVIQPITRTNLFGSRPFLRKLVTTARTTTKLEEEENNYSEEYDEEDEKVPEKLFVLVPDSKLFTRAPKNQELPKEYNWEEEAEDEYDDKYEDVSEEDQDTSAKEPFSTPSFVPKTISNTFFRSTVSPDAISKNRLANNTRVFNRPSEGKRAQNKPIGYAPNKTSTNNISSTESPLPKSVQEAVKEKHKLLFSKSKVHEISQNQQNSSTEERKSIEISSFEAILDDKDEEYLSTTDEIKRIYDTYNSTFNTTTISETTKDYFTEQFTTIFSENTTPIQTTADDFESNTDTVLFEEQKDVSISDYSETTDEIMVTDKYETTSEISSTISHHIFAVTDDYKSTEQINDTSSESLENYFTTIDTTITERPTTKLPATDFNPILKTQFDRLFSVSRLVEISSKQDKHRINKHNESRLIETGNVKQEKKPKLDKIGAVNRFTLIKIIEDDIPIYLTKLGHVYPVENPPNNFIRIDEARNAKSLKNLSDSGNENLIASESINEAYRFINNINGKSDPISNGEKNKNNKTIKEENKDNKTIDNVKHIKTVELPEQALDTYPSVLSRWNFYPAAYYDEKNAQTSPSGRSIDIITPRSYSTEPSTLALEGLFKTEYPPAQLARKVPENKVIEFVEGHEPFVVYAAPRSPNVNIQTRDEVLPVEERSDSVNKTFVNFVKLEVLKPDVGRSVKTYAKGQEFSALSHDSPTVKYPISISIISSDGDPINPKTVHKQKLENKTTESYKNTDTNAEVNLTIDTSQSALTTATPHAPSTIKVTIDNMITTTDTTETPTDSTTETTTSRLQLVNSSSTNAAKKSPKLNFPRRFQPKNSDITRISVSPLASSASIPRSFKVTIPPVNISSVKLSRAGNFTSKSRFSSNRSQNIPVDNRRSQNQANARTFKKQNSTEVVRIKAATSESSRKLNVKPVRPIFLRGSQFRKSSTTPAPQVSEE